MHRLQGVDDIDNENGVDDSVDVMMLIHVDHQRQSDSSVGRRQMSGGGHLSFPWFIVIIIFKIIFNKQTKKTIKSWLLRPWKKWVTTLYSVSM